MSTVGTIFPLINLEERSPRAAAAVALEEFRFTIVVLPPGKRR